MDIEHQQEMSLTEEEEVFLILHEIIHAFVMFLTMIALSFGDTRCVRGSQASRSTQRTYSLLIRILQRIEYLQGLVGISDEECLIHMRMNRTAFSSLLSLVETQGCLTKTKYCSTTEQLAYFLKILAHHTKNRVVKSSFKRSGRTVSKNFHRILNAIIRLHSVLLIRPEPIDEHCSNERWNWFKGCLGALDGTYIPVSCPKQHTGWYRNRKGHVSVNLLAVCDFDMNFIYVLSGWEGSAADSRVLRDAITRENGLRVPRGNYYLCDNGYTNGEGFLTPYRGVRYHLSEWEAGTLGPQNKEELFNLKHSKARNIIERAFGLLKKTMGHLEKSFLLSHPNPEPYYYGL